MSRAEHGSRGWGGSVDDHTKGGKDRLAELTAPRPDLARRQASAASGPDPGLSTVSVPPVLAPIFLKAQEYVERYFSSRAEDPRHGTITISGERYILVRAASMSVEFFDLVMSLYKDRDPEEARNVARNILFDLAHSIGKADAKAFHAKMGVTDPVDRLSAGPVHFSFAGWAFVRIHPESAPGPDEDFFLFYDHPFSFESDSWVRRGRKSDFPVCIMNSGYSSGWCEESFGLPLVAAEVECLAVGDAQCRFIMAPPGRIEEHLSRFSEGARPSPSRLHRPARAAGVDVPEFFQRKRMEEALRESNVLLESRVRERTADLAEANQALVAEIVQRRRVEREQRKFAALVANSDDFIGMATLEGKPIFVNEAGTRLIGASSPEEALARSFEETHTPETRRQLREVIFPALMRAGRWEGETQFRNSRTGAAIDLHMSAFVVKDPVTGERLCIATVARDITERKKAEEERRKLEAQVQSARHLESLGVLAGGIAHDFNNLLVGILGNAALALADLPPDSPARASIEGIEASARRAAELTHQMLAYSGRGKFVVERLHLSRLVEEVARLSGTVVGKKALLQLRLAPDLPLMEADAAQVRQVIMSLLTNASDALGEEGGTITITTGLLHAGRFFLRGGLLNDDLPEGPYVFLEVSDTGCGMDEATRARVFDPFFSTKFTGRGLGLPAVLGILRGHRGTIRMTSAPGEGTTIRVLFPALAPPASEGRGGDEVAGPAGGPSMGVVLVVDDEEVVRSVAALALEKAGFTVLTAENGRRAIEVFRMNAGSIAAVLLDVTMPELSGDETLAELRRMGARVPVLITSGYMEAEATGRFAGQGIAAFVQKPFHPADLVTRVREILGS